MPVVLDVDTGVDDALALLLAACSPELEVLAVTCVAGNATLEQVGANTRAVLDLAGLEAVPVALGAPRPLLNEPSVASYVHGKNGIAELDIASYGATTPSRGIDARNAIELLRDTLRAAPEPVTIIALAPLTNLALLLRLHPELVTSIAQIAVMGGGYGVGNATATAEFNIWHDPESAEIVFSSGVPVLLYGLDVFYDARLRASDVAQLRASEEPLAALAADLCDWLGEVYAAEPRVAEAPYLSCLGDAGLVAVLLEPELLTTRTYPVRVAVADPLTRGTTVVDRRWSADAPAFLPLQFTTPLVEVGVELDGDRCVAAFVERLTGAAPLSAPPVDRS